MTNATSANRSGASQAEGGADARGGGASAGLSATMPPWGAVLSDDEVKGLVAKIREFGK